MNDLKANNLKVKNLLDLRRVVEETETIRVVGRVTRVVGTVIEGRIPACAVGQMCHLLPGDNRQPILGEVVGFHDHHALLMPLGEMRGLRPGSPIHLLGASPKVKVGESLLGRVLDGMGNPMDGGPVLSAEDEAPLYAEPANP